MSYKRVNTKGTIIVETDNSVLQIKTVSELSTATSIKDTLEAVADKQLSDLFIHKNRDGTIAIATGKEPKVWPEDETSLMYLIKK